MFKDRTKPWGTGHAVLACKDILKESFVVCNADDYYGKEAYQVAYKYLSDEHKYNATMMVGFKLRNTLSDNGTVTRGICV